VRITKPELFRMNPRPPSNPGKRYSTVHRSTTFHSARVVLQVVDVDTRALRAMSPESGPVTSSALQAHGTRAHDSECDCPENVDAAEQLVKVP
jgi:hypothetical protein